MLSSQHFYYKLLRKYVQTFGNMFNQITLVRLNQSGTNEIQRIKVPIIYSPKDKMVTRLNTDPDLQRDVGIVLPRMGFELKGIHYDAARKQNTLLRAAKGDNASRMSSQFMGVPYDFTFELNLYAKTIDDGNQIIEQILPYFTPDYTITIEPVQEVGFLKDIPIILNSVVQNVDYEGDQEKVRYVYWTLEFTLKGYFFGPVSKPKIIRKVITNIWNDPSLVRGHVIRMNLANGNNGMFKTGDTVYVGDNLNTTPAFGFVSHWNPVLGRLEIGEAHGNFEINQTLRGASTNATYQIESFDATPIKLSQIVIEPDPLDAQPDDDFGYTTTITEWPLTEYSSED
jgi:hypothetical protein